MGVWIGVGLAAAALLAALLYRPARRLLRDIEFERARELFLLQRERLEAKFFELASATGKPKGLQWEDCDFQSPVSFVRDRGSGQLSAFVEVTIRFTAVEGGGMEHVQAVGNLRNATAVFHYHHGQWGTGGRALFNMNPTEAIQHFQAQFEPVQTGG
jgi:hypothetical protein